MSVRLQELVAFLDAWLDVAGVPDASRNGLQVEASAEVARVAVAVDAAEATIAAAVRAQCELLFVHHGLLFGEIGPLTGPLARSLGACFRAGLSVYAAHLPLDRHPEVGNNHLLLRALGAERDGEFGAVGGVPIGALGTLPEPRPLARVAGMLAAAGADEQILWAFGPDPVRRLAVVTGSGCSLLGEAVAAGADCLVTGEPRHSAYHAARESGINCLFGGHYATETFGVRAVGERLRERFGLEVRWIDHPTGV